MHLVDTHCHLDFPDFDADRNEVIQRSGEAGVVRMLCPGADRVSSGRAVKLSRENAEIFAAVGIHPHEADISTDADIREIRALALESDKVVAIGEIGLDNYRKHSAPENQEKLFREFLRMAGELDLPVIIHNREADAGLIRIIEQVNTFKLRGVVHCYSGSKALLKELLARDLYISFTGSITFDGADKLRELAAMVPPERLLLETDAPYMSPAPERGKRNEPARVKYLLGTFAGIYGLSAEDVARITTLNADQLFYLGIRGVGTIAYPIRDSLYLNITHRCTNRCCFCTRNVSSIVKGHDLRLYQDPTTEQVIASLGDLSRYREVTFCGLGEPLLRPGTLKKVAGYIKDKGKRVRVNTNGEANLIAGRDITPELNGLVDKVSISLNACDGEGYDHTCHSSFGVRAYDGILDFISGCVANGIRAEVTCLDMLGEEAVAKVRKAAEEMGASFRLRRINVVG